MEDADFFDRTESSELLVAIHRETRNQLVEACRDDDAEENMIIWNIEDRVRFLSWTPFDDNPSLRVDDSRDNGDYSKRRSSTKINEYH